jgi:hypothetical protein
VYGEEMIIIHIDSGLGNQMLGYCEYLALKKINPNEEFYIETLVYEISECNDAICQWNGFELNKVFSIEIPNLSEKLGEEQYAEFKTKVFESKFWEKNWNFSPYVCQALNDLGYQVENNCRIINESKTKEPSGIKKFIKCHGGDVLKYWINLFKQNINKNQYLQNYNDSQNTFLKVSGDILSGQRFSFIHLGNNIELIEKEIREAFTFPALEDLNNLNILSLIQSTNSVAIHARRGDMLGRTGVYYKGGYFRRAVKYIKKNVKNPYFFFFCDPGSSEWCKNNLRLFNLNKKDKVFFVDWNKAEYSYIDMYLMMNCKHNIVTNSSFGWWGAFLNENPNKITCSPDISYNTKYHF